MDRWFPVKVIFGPCDFATIRQRRSQNDCASFSTLKFLKAFRSVTNVRSSMFPLKEGYGCLHVPALQVTFQIHHSRWGRNHHRKKKCPTMHSSYRLLRATTVVDESRIVFCHEYENILNSHIILGWNEFVFCGQREGWARSTMSSSSLSSWPHVLHHAAVVRRPWCCLASHRVEHIHHHHHQQRHPCWSLVGRCSGCSRRHRFHSG